jgi:uncharacterized protein YcnI
MSTRSIRLARRSAAVAAVAALTVLSAASPAAAHVTVNPGTAEQGSFTKVSFRVPNERDNASTTRLQVDLPTDHPIESVSVRPVPGWQVKVVTSKLDRPVQTEDTEITEAVTRITWSGGEIDPGQFQEFDVSMGPLPTSTDRLVLPAVQTYSGGEIVRWDQDPGNGAEEPEHPAPVLRLTPQSAAGDAHGGGAEPGANPAAGAQPAAATESAASASDGTARLLGWLGLAAGVVGVVVGGLGLARARRSS